VKLLLFGLVFWTAIAIDVCFAPFIEPFMEIGQQGSTPEREEAVSRAVNNTLVAVSTLYVLIASIAFIGKVKPFRPARPRKRPQASGPPVPTPRLWQVTPGRPKTCWQQDLQRTRQRLR